MTMINDWFDTPILPLPSNDHISRIDIKNKSPLAGDLYDIFEDIVKDLNHDVTYVELTSLAEYYTLETIACSDINDAKFKFACHTAVYVTIMSLTMPCNFVELVEVGVNFVSTIIDLKRADDEQRNA